MTKKELGGPWGHLGHPSWEEGLLGPLVGLDPCGFFSMTHFHFSEFLSRTMNNRVFAPKMTFLAFS